MLSIIIVLLNLLIETSVSLTVVVPPDPIEAHVGSTVILPCWISPPENAEALEIRWYRPNQFNNPVLLYNQKKIQDIQEESYRNRSSLTLRSDQSGGLEDGDVSLRLEKLTFQDEDSFHCYVSGEHSYDSAQVVLKITALGSAPVLSPKSLDDGRVNISCRSSGWYPEPSVSWTSDVGRDLRPGGTSHTRGEDEMISTHSWTAVSLSDAQLVSCSVSLRTGELKEGRLDIQGIVSPGTWMALFLILLICVLLGLFGLILYKYRHKLTGKKPAEENCEEETLERLIKAVVEDMNTEELREHAVEITIDRERLHPGLRVSNNCKILRDSEEYKPTGEGFPYQLCAFGAQIFTSGRHYWEVELALENTPPKIFWMIGVVKHGNFIIRDSSALTPSRGFWFLCSDGPRGFYTNTDPPVKLSLTPRPERLGVLFDYDDGQLSFYNVTERKHLLTISSRFSGSVVPLFNPGAGDESPLKILDLPKPVEPAEPSQPSQNNMVTVELDVKASDNPETVEPAEPSQPLLSNMVAVELDVKASDNPETVEQAESSQASHISTSDESSAVGISNSSDARLTKAV
ncbi:butyrophilin subfamily 1 member A1-like isoform X2 [Carassius carassius]|uniref:butyrophilin subfamily 1 member A1-like isoform X2 n=1 Tax=Carassius carassius TaxID=217509 RepID=UPI002868E078|nr:butyrophilin subfamily 1 member A1-like isoform X2 [Carassius carassius]